MMKLLSDEKRLAIKIDHPDYFAVSGSRLYGTSKPDSDLDIRGFIVPPYPYLLGVKRFDCKKVPGHDTKIYSLKRFFDLLCSGEPQNTELLFVPEDKILCKSKIGEAVLEKKEIFLSNSIYRRITGYGYSEWRKALAQKLVIPDRTKDEDDIISWIRNNKSWDKDRMDTFVEWINEDKEKKVVQSKKDLGKKRKLEHEKFGYGVSSATHAIRLKQELAELLSTGKISFPRPNAEELLAIRQGKYNLVEVEKIFNDASEKAEKARDHSVLPDKINMKLVGEFYMELVSKEISELSRKCGTEKVYYHPYD